MSVVKPLYGHSSEESAFLVADYPYGRKLRCRIRYYLESNGKGFRLVSQTENPKAAIPYWNAPKKSTYMEHAGCMFLDEQNHTQWAGIGIYSTAEQVVQFIKDFPLADFDRLRLWVKMKVIYQSKVVDGSVYWKVAGVKQEKSEGELERDKEELVKWQEAASLLPEKQG